MKYMSIDFGNRRVGVATSDESGKMAFPYLVLHNDGSLLNEVLKIIKKEQIGEIIIGESKDFKGISNKIMEKIEVFVKVLEDETKLKVHLEPEFMTSVQATHLQGKNEMHDASAAAIILQSYLDKLK